MKRILPPVCLLLFMSGCAMSPELLRGLYQEPAITVEKISLTGFDLEKVSVTFDLAIQNPNPVSISLREISYRLCVDSPDRELVSSTNRSPVEIQAKGKSRVPFPLAVRYAAITNLDWSATNLPYVFEGTAVVDTVIGPVSLPFRVEGAVPIPRLPVVRLEKLEAMNFSPLQLKAAFELTVFISNKNPFPLGLKNLDYSLNLNAKSLSRGVTREESISIPSRSSGRIFILVDVDLSALKDIALSLIQGTAVKFGFTGSYKFDGTAAPATRFGYTNQGNTIIEK